MQKLYKYTLIQECLVGNIKQNKEREFQMLKILVIDTARISRVSINTGMITIAKLSYDQYLLGDKGDGIWRPYIIKTMCGLLHGALKISDNHYGIYPKLFIYIDRL